MKANVLLTATLLTGGLIALCWAQQGPPPRPDGQENGADQPPPPPPPPMGPGPLMLALDTDKDGKLSAAEIANAPAALATLDKNHDGVLTRDELRPPPPPPPNGKGRADHIMRLDTDGDGVVSLDEFLVPPKDAFAGIDANHDGHIDADEAAAAPPPPPPGPRHGPPPQGGAQGDDPNDAGPPQGNGAAPHRPQRPHQP